jgi:hypothetical protein
MKQLWTSPKPYFASITFFVGLIFFLNISLVNAAIDPIIPRGAALYDKWFAVPGTDPSVSVPVGNMPVWSRQVTNSRSGPDTWRCTTCHGWDYQGKDGAYSTGSNFTGFPGLINASQTMPKEKILEQLSGVRDPQHDFSPYLSSEDLNALAVFIQQGMIDDAKFIDPVSLKTIGANSENGKNLYNASCSTCHGLDGNTLKIRFDGQDVGLGLIAVQDPWRFLHKTRFGTPGTKMVIGYELGWTPQDGRDVLSYIQNVQAGQKVSSDPVGLDETRSTPGSPVGGPAQNFFGGLLTIIGAMSVGLGINILAGASLIGILLLIVWILRGR